MQTLILKLYLQSNDELQVAVAPGRALGDEADHLHLPDGGLHGHGGRPQGRAPRDLHERLREVHQRQPVGQSAVTTHILLFLWY